MSVLIAPIHKKKWTRKPTRLLKDDDELGPLREQEEETEPEVITRSLSLSELRDMQKDFSRHPDEHIITWLFQCWDSRASSLELEGREAKQLGSLSREGGIDKAIGKKTQALSLWRQLLSSVRERYPFSEDVVCQPGKWTTMERGIQYLREIAMQDMVYYDPNNAQLLTVHELQGKTVTKGDSSRKNAAPLSSGQPPRASERPNHTYDPLEGTSKSFLQEVSSEYDEQD
ncbi:hypothetical protein GRJ2_003386700 [Grus japonensis]|uniref:Ubiquitin carboxyl-terminal hydrolase 4 n=1 Tax=Grus japonensis TaxID=30415 RepID=A0ABC9YGN6_GRUJA